MGKIGSKKKISKTARASSGEVKRRYVRACPEKGCLLPMTATRVLTKPRGMYWVCQCGHREKI